MENNIRLGKISAVDYAAGTVRVVYHEKDDAVTAPIPLISSEYFMPEVDDMVMVCFTSPTARRRAWSWADRGARRTSPRRVPKGFTAKTWPVRRVRP